MIGDVVRGADSRQVATLVRALEALARCWASLPRCGS